jgi:hypothetical protein
MIAALAMKKAFRELGIGFDLLKLWDFNRWDDKPRIERI